jgi:hypothetical protein
MEITIKQWEEIKLKMAVGGAIIFGGLSILFSMLGLSMSTEVPWAWLVGLLMAMGITIIQLVGNSEGKKDSIFTVIWIASYIYGITANVMGITGLMSGVSPVFMYMIAVPMGILIEIVPEKLLIISLGGDLRKTANTVSNLFSKPKTSAKIRPTSVPTYKYTPSHRPTYGSGGNNGAQKYDPSAYSHPQPFLDD